MAKSVQRVVYDIDPDVVARFERIYAPEKRSEIVERLMIRALEANAAETAAAARMIATDPDFREFDALSDWADAQAVDTLARF